LVGLASAKAGLERLSPYATPVCLVSANIADADFVTLFFGDRWTLLQHHRGITHSIVGTLAIGFLVPLVAVAIERLIVKARKTTACIRFPGLLIASFVTAATHPLLDWTNNYGLRPFLPWSARWFYGDLVFIVDPYIWLLLGAVCFLLTSNSRSQMRSWAILGSGIAMFIGFATWRSRADARPLRVVFVIWLLVMLVLAIVRASGSHKYVKRSAVIAALVILVVYWGVLAFAHRSALADTFLSRMKWLQQVANRWFASQPCRPLQLRWNGSLLRKRIWRCTGSQSKSEVTRTAFRSPSHGVVMKSRPDKPRSLCRQPKGIGAPKFCSASPGFQSGA